MYLSLFEEFNTDDIYSKDIDRKFAYLMPLFTQIDFLKTIYLRLSILF